MTQKISDLYGKVIFSGNGERLGSIKDVILDTEEGKVERISTQGMKKMSKNKLREVLKENTIPFDKVESVGDIVLLKSQGSVSRTKKKEEKGKKSSKAAEGALSSMMSQQ